MGNFEHNLKEERLTGGVLSWLWILEGRDDVFRRESVLECAEVALMV